MRLQRGCVLFVTALCAAGALAPAQGPTAGAAPVFGLLEMINGDRMQVAIEGFDGAAGLLRVRHPFARDALDVQVSALTRFNVQTPKDESPPPAGDWNVQLANGDQIICEGVTLDADRLQMRNALIGAVSAPRVALAGLNRASASRIIYEGPQKDEEWLRNRASFKLTDARATAAQGEFLGIKLPALPRKTRVDIELQWAFPNFIVHLFTKNVTNVWDGSSAGYQFSYQMGNQILINRLLPGMGAQPIGTVPIRAPAARKGSFSFFFDLDNGVVAVMMNNRLLAEWKDPTAAPELGTHIGFLSHQGSLEVLKLRVSEWNGLLPNAGQPRPASDTDSIILKNGDNLSGTLVKIAATSATVRSPFGELAIPLDNIRRMDLKYDAPLKSGDGVRLTLKDGSSVTVVIQKIENGSLFGNSPSLGSVRIPLDGVRQAIWSNPPSKRSESEDDIAPTTSGSNVRGMRMIGGAGVNVILQNAAE